MTITTRTPNQIISIRDEFINRITVLFGASDLQFKARGSKHYMSYVLQPYSYNTEEDYEKVYFKIKQDVESIADSCGVDFNSFSLEEDTDTIDPDDYSVCICFDINYQIES